MDRKKFITFAVVAAFALIPATANADPYEPNDSALTAWGPLYPSTDYVATMDTANDQDWFVFYVPYREQTSATFTGGPGAYTRVVLEGTDVNGNVEESGGARDPTHQGAPGEQHVAHGRVPVHRQHPWRHVLLQPSLDGGRFRSHGSPVTFRNLSRRTHTFRVYAVLRNQRSRSASFTWRVRLA